MSPSVINQLEDVATFFWLCMNRIWNVYSSTILVFVIALYIVALLVRWFKRLFF